VAERLDPFVCGTRLLFEILKLKRRLVAVVEVSVHQFGIPGRQFEISGWHFEIGGWEK